MSHVAVSSGAGPEVPRDFVEAWRSHPVWGAEICRWRCSRGMRDVVSCALTARSRRAVWKLLGPWPLRR